MIRRPESMWLQSARETFYKASDAFFKANAAASYNDWKRARAHWDYVYPHSAFQMCMQHAVIHATNGTCQRSQHANIPVLILADQQRVSGVRFSSAVFVRFLCARFVVHCIPCLLAAAYCYQEAVVIVCSFRFKHSISEWKFICCSCQNVRSLHIMSGCSVSAEALHYCCAPASRRPRARC